MQPILKWLNRPYPFVGTWRDNLKSALYGGLFVFLFLVLFKPFGMDAPDSMFWYMVLICSYFGLVTACVLLLNAFIMRMLPAWFHEEKWVVWKEILTNIFVVLMIGTCNLILAVFIFNQPLTPSAFLVWQKVTLLIAVFPILFTAYTKQLILQKRHTSGAQNLNTKIADHPKCDTEKTPFLNLQGDNQNESLSLAPSTLLYLEASDNYVRVFYHENGSVESSMLRSTLKKMEGQLDSYPQFFRCHRTYLVNLDKVEHVSGNAQGFKLHLENGGALLPVSRSLNVEIVERFK